MDGTRRAMYYYSSEQTTGELKRGFQTFFENDVKILFLSSNREIEKLICAAESAGLFTPDYVWYARTWVWGNLMQNISFFCTDKQIQNLKKADGFFAVDTTPHLSTWEESDVLMTRDLLYEDIRKRIREDFGNSSGFEPTFYDLYVYDAIWLVAKTVEDIWNKTGPSLFESFFESTKRNSFTGVSGEISYGDGPSPLGPRFALRQFKGFEEKITLAEGPIRDMIFIRNVSWVGGSVPLDFTPKIVIKNFYDFQKINSVTATGLVLTSTAFLLVTLFCFVVNNIFRKKKMIKITSPMINNVILLGVMLVLTTVIVGSYLSFAHDSDTYLIVCYARTMLLAVGFTFGFGGLFCKTWRVYRALTDKTANQQLVISDVSLMSKIGVMLIFDVFYIALKTSWDPYFVQETIVETEVARDPANTMENRLNWVVLTCQSDTGYFEVALAAGKFLIVIFGVFLSFETRSVHIDELNDSKTIAVSIYNVVICCVFGALTIYTAGDAQVTLSYILRSVVVLFCTAVLVGTHFLPHQIKVTFCALSSKSFKCLINLKKLQDNANLMII